MELQTLKFYLLSLCLLAAVALVLPECAAARRSRAGGERQAAVAVAVKGLRYASATSCRAHSAAVTEFGAVGDGATSNTAAFRAAVGNLSQYSAAGRGGGMLYVPAGRWLTGPFNLTSSFTLFLHRDAVILASQDINEWPIIDPLPSYGRGRDKPGGRYSSLIGGSNLTDVIITGDNGTIDGQGATWWQKFHKNQLKYTRGYLIELMHSDQIIISNLTLLNSPAWNIHPVYSSNIIVSGITILAPVHSPNTDGINPDSCSHVRIEDCYIVSGDDCVAIKSGWDEYGIAYGMPSQHIVIRRLTCVSPTSAVIALGSEMSGGIQDVRAEDITAVNSESGVRIKTAPGRGAYVKDVFVRGMSLDTMKWVFWMTGNYKSHPDGNYNPNAMPVVNGVSYSNVVATGVTTAARLEGIPGAPFTGICISNVTVELAKSRKVSWTCTDVEGVSADVSPAPCAPLQGAHDGQCPFPADRLPIDEIEFKECSY
ncbi:probable polygalacturonase [Ananas comosus]|uniref:Probable polygalacturonase n=1 Tax=Ananas comosus TaxID=4615 RepID=A0A6P5GYB4_ANACO|nr:probable polygalacturonase [Ananas comosus]